MISKSFTAAGESLHHLLKPGDRAGYSITGTYTGTIVLEQCKKGDANWESIDNSAGAAVSVTSTSGAGVVSNIGTRSVLLRFRSTTAMTGTAVCGLGSVPASTVRTGIGQGVSGVSVVEAGNDIVHQTTIVLGNFPITLRNTETGQGAKIYAFPEGRIAILGAVGSIAMVVTSILANTLNTGKTYNWGLGSTTQAGGTLATTEQDIIPTTNGVSSATINVTGAASPGQLAAALQLDGCTTPVDAFLNIGIATADDIDGDATVLINGTVTITWMNLGDV
jgi:hypothetical protein